jgi:hypothetical protein
MTAIVLLIVLILIGLAAASGHTADTRDPAHGVGPLLRRRLVGRVGR